MDTHSPTSPDFWTALAGLATGRALDSVWRRLFEANFPFLQPFLGPTIELASGYPCPRSPWCDCDHEVRENSDGRLLAVCTCADAECASVPIQRSDLVVQALDHAAFGAAIGEALGLSQRDATNRAGELPSAWKIGFQPALRVSVWLHFPRAGLAPNSASPGFWLGRDHANIVLTPNFAFLAPRSLAALRASGCLPVALSNILAPQGGGGFVLKQSPETLLADWSRALAALGAPAVGLGRIQRLLSAVEKRLDCESSPPGPPDEEVARQSFAVIQRLDADQPLEPPSILTVFRLYCMEALSAAQAARRCHCSKATIISRLNLIRKRTGASPQSFRRLSPHIGQLEDQIRDFQAARLERRRLVADNEDPQR